VYDFRPEAPKASIEHCQSELGHQTRTEIGCLGETPHYRFNSLTCVNVLPRKLDRDDIGVG
jgi:hypothetical protein